MQQDYNTFPDPKNWYNLPYTVDSIDDVYIVEKYGAFYLCKKEKEIPDTVWMATNWACISELLSQIELAHGRVLCTGLGMGLIPLLIANKPEVSEVHVVENDPSIIKLFKKQGFNTNKLVLVQADALTYSESNFDCIMLDHYNGYLDIGYQHMLVMANTIKSNTNSPNALTVPFRWQEFSEHFEKFGLGFLSQESLHRYKYAYKEAIDSMIGITESLKQIHMDRQNVTAFN